MRSSESDGCKNRYGQCSQSAANFWAGGLASEVFWLGSFPFDAVKKWVSCMISDVVAFVLIIRVLAMAHQILNIRVWDEVTDDTCNVQGLSLKGPTKRNQQRQMKGPTAEVASESSQEGQ